MAKYYQVSIITSEEIEAREATQHAEMQRISRGTLISTFMVSALIALVGYAMPPPAPAQSIELVCKTQASASHATCYQSGSGF